KSALAYLGHIERRSRVYPRSVSTFPENAPTGRLERPERPCRRPLLCKRLIYGPDHRLDLFGMWAEILGQLVQVGIADLLETRLVDVGDDLDSHRLELCRRLPLELERFFGFLRADVLGGGQDPLLLFRVEALPQLVADPDNRVVRLMLAHRKHGCDFVVLV